MMTKKKKIKDSPFTKDDWTNESLAEGWEIIKDLAIRKYGLDFYKPNFEVVNFEDMLHIYTGSLPVTYDHWSHGKKYQELYKKYADDRMGVAYEIVFNTSPALCYLLEHNSPTMQALTMSHAAVGHTAFFKNNVFFKEMTNAGTIMPFLKNSKAYIADCEEKYGAQEVERILDACHALSYYAIDRRPIVEKTRKEREAIRLARAEAKDTEYDTTVETIKLNNNVEDCKPRTFQREENMLKFIGKFSPALKQWQRDVIAIYCQIQQYLYPQMLTKMANEGYACQSGDSEYLSETGFKRIDQYDGGKIAQYNKDGTIEFVQPTKYHEYADADLLEIKSEGVNQCVTPNHRIVYNSSRWSLNEIRADELNTSTNRYFITGGHLKTDSKLNLTDAELRVMVAIVADGHFNPNTTTKHCQMTFVKERKITRFKELLLAAKISFEVQNQTQGRTCFSFYAPERNKELSKYYKASKHQLGLILEEYSNWDGCTNKKGRITYFGINKTNMDFLQYAITMRDGKARLATTHPPGNRQPLYIVEALRSPITTLSGGSIIKLEGKHKVYCFTVPSGMFITRRENIVNITGNSFWHHTIMNDLSDQGLVNESGTLEFLHSHCSVLRQPDFDDKRGYGGINPYKLGFEMFKDIQRICENPTDEDKQWFPDLIGKNWIDAVKFAAYNFKDESFILQYLSPKLMRDFKLFMITDDDKAEELKISEIHDDEGYKEIRRNLAAHYNFLNHIPDLYIEGWDAKRSRTLYMCFQEKNGVELDMDGGSAVAELVESLWPFPIKFKYIKTDGSIDESAT